MAKLIQPPKGTRDFYPQEMAWHQHLQDTWRAVSQRHGFEQVDGPIFETLELYKVKSGEGIVNELFSFKRANGKIDYAIRPEFTPTLVRMVAARANSLPKPIKWYCMSNFCRAERPQRGRLREFWQWNVDMLGLEGPQADAEVIAAAADCLATLGLNQSQMRIKISHRETVRQILLKLGVPEERMLEAFNLLDRRDKLDEAEFGQEVTKLGLDVSTAQRFDEVCRMKYRTGSVDKMAESLALGDEVAELRELDKQLHDFGIADWCEYDLGIVRGLAYYTGTVFEVHETTGAMRAVAGGGRYDKLVELFGGPATPAVGFAMGDVVIADVLTDKGLMPADVAPVPQVYVVAASDAGAARLTSVTAQLRRAGVHARFSYKSTRNLGKLLKEATNARALRTLILDDGVSEGKASLKDMSSGEQQEVSLDALVELF